MMKRLLFVCVENSWRSQIAEAFARIHGGNEVEAYSAGSRPSGEVLPKPSNPRASSATTSQSTSLNQTVETASFKRPLDRRVRIGLLGLEGDEHANKAQHGGSFKALLAYPSEHYDEFWRDALGRIPLSHVHVTGSQTSIRTTC